MRHLVLGLAICAMAGCGGSERFYFGSTIVEPDSAGNVAGLGSNELTTVRRGDLGFVYGFADDVDATRVGNSAGATSGDRGAFAVAGVLPDADVGAPITRGEAFLAGQFALVKVTGVERTPDTSLWTQEELKGGFTATVSLEEDEPIPGIVDDGNGLRELYLTGASDDGRVVIPRSVIVDLTGGSDGTEVEGLGSIEMTVDGQSVAPIIQLAVGRSALIAAFAGSGSDIVVSGGIALGGVAPR